MHLSKYYNHPQAQLYVALQIGMPTRPKSGIQSNRAPYVMGAGLMHFVSDTVSSFLSTLTTLYLHMIWAEVVS